MTLATYRRKRRFRATPEPRGKRRRSAGALRFVVQKHHASRLHYDFRLELGGTLKSWAVPKGPSLNPDDKRLAIHVEDHPLDYRRFEGTIPAGNYGAGTVMIWDQGTYQAPGVTDRDENEQLVEEGLQRGRLSFILHGSKLNGEFALVKLKQGKENEWLLIKKHDAFATPLAPPDADTSAVSNRTLEEITQGMAPRQKRTAAVKSRGGSHAGF